MPGPDPIRRINLGCPPPIVQDELGREYLDTRTDLTGQKVCLQHLRDALVEIEDWVSSIRRTLECFDLDDCACCSDRPRAEVDLEGLANGTRGAITEPRPSTPAKSPSKSDV